MEDRAARGRKGSGRSYSAALVVKGDQMPSKRKRVIAFNLSWRANAWKFLVTFAGFKGVEHAKLDALRDYYLYEIK